VGCAHRTGRIPLKAASDDGMDYNCCFYEVEKRDKAFNRSVGTAHPAKKGPGIIIDPGALCFAETAG